MASLFELNSNSSESEDDCDYIPENGGEESEVSDDEGEFSDEDFPKKRKTPARTKHNDTKVEDSGHESPKSSPVTEKKRVEEVWNNFLKEVGESKREEKFNESPKDTKEIAVKSCDLPSGNVVDKTTVTEVYDFAGETITITKEVENDGKSALQAAQSTACVKSEEANRVNQPLSNSNKRRAGIESILGSIVNKKGKMTTLQKSLLDWNSFKKEEGLKEELEQYNKGKGGFLQKQEFLQRSDLRRFELEKSARLSKYKKK